MAWSAAGSSRRRRNTAGGGSPARPTGREPPHPPRRPARSGLDRDPLPQRIRHPARPDQPAAARPQAASEASRGALGRLPRVPPHLRLNAHQARHQPPPSQPSPRPLLARLQLTRYTHPLPGDEAPALELVRDAADGDCLVGCAFLLLTPFHSALRPRMRSSSRSISSIRISKKSNWTNSGSVALRTSSASAPLITSALTVI